VILKISSAVICFALSYEILTFNSAAWPNIKSDKHDENIHLMHEQIMKIIQYLKLEEYNRRANMTYDQGLQLCKQRRSVVDPIQAFCEQLKQYEKECRELGYLTSVDTKNDEDNTSNHDGNASAKKESCNARHIGAEGNVCSKRKAEANHAHSVNKKRVVGPSIGPTRPSIGPSKPSIGPSSRPSLNAAKSERERG
jgi:hypothetical protein